ncbi:helix-turn-helix transcriptional regulator [bacterium]|nr:helix-turn-helix transcriptional regulator [bacterium]
MYDSKNIKKIFGANVKELRTNKGITQEQLAEYLGLQPHSITKIETGRTFVSSEVLAKLCNFFNITPSFFLNHKVKVFTQDDIDFSNEIKRLLPNFSPTKLREIYNILNVMDK